MMLALIQLLSQNAAGAITDGRRRAGRSRGTGCSSWTSLPPSATSWTWYFLLAMAHARTEIVRFEEVWWRIRMVTPSV